MVIVPELFSKGHGTTGGSFAEGSIDKEMGARSSHTPTAQLHFLQRKLQQRLVGTATSRSTYSTTPFSCRCLLIRHSTVVTEPTSFSTNAENGVSSNSDNIIIIISIIASERHRLLQQRLLQRDYRIKTRHGASTSDITIPSSLLIGPRVVGHYPPLGLDGLVRFWGRCTITIWIAKDIYIARGRTGLTARFSCFIVRSATRLICTGGRR